MCLKEDKRIQVRPQREHADVLAYDDEEEVQQSQSSVKECFKEENMENALVFWKGVCFRYPKGTVLKYFAATRMKDLDSCDYVLYKKPINGQTLSDTEQPMEDLGEIDCNQELLKPHSSFSDWQRLRIQVLCKRKNHWNGFVLRKKYAHDELSRRPASQRWKIENGISADDCYFKDNKDYALAYISGQCISYNPREELQPHKDFDFVLYRPPGHDIEDVEDADYESCRSSDAEGVPKPQECKNILRMPHRSFSDTGLCDFQVVCLEALGDSWLLRKRQSHTQTHRWSAPVENVDVDACYRTEHAGAVVYDSAVCYLYDQGKIVKPQKGSFDAILYKPPQP